VSRTQAASSFITTVKPAHFDDPKVLLEVGEEVAGAMKGV